MTAADALEGRRERRRGRIGPPWDVNLLLCLAAGLHPLAPYLTQLIAAETAARLGSLAHLALLLGTAEALMRNPGIDMEPYVHQLLPAVVTCLVARRLGVRPLPDRYTAYRAAHRPCCLITGRTHHCTNLKQTPAGISTGPIETRCSKDGAMRPRSGCKVHG
jgi:hypothetical protein